VSFAKQVFTIGFDPSVEDHLSLVDHPRNHTLLQTKLAELGHAEVQIKFVKAESPAQRKLPATVVETSAPATAVPVPATIAVAKSALPVAKEKLTPVPFNKDEFKNDPLIAKALEIFKGQIVEVRA
jgi:hypothetical protein